MEEFEILVDEPPRERAMRIEQAIEQPLGIRTLFVRTGFAHPWSIALCQ